jgi:hypothetical protein
VTGNAYPHVIKGSRFFTRLRSQNDFGRCVTKEGDIVRTVLGVLEKIATGENDFTLGVFNIY